MCSSLNSLWIKRVKISFANFFTALAPAVRADVFRYTHLSCVIFVTGLIEFQLTDDVPVHAFYHHFYLLLEVEKLVKCSFIVCTFNRCCKPSK